MTSESTESMKGILNNILGIFGNVQYSKLLTASRIT